MEYKLNSINDVGFYNGCPAISLRGGEDGALDT